MSAAIATVIAALAAALVALAGRVRARRGGRNLLAFYDRSMAADGRLPAP